MIVNNQTNETTTIKVDGVFLAIGYQPTVDLATKINAELTPDGYIKQDSQHRTNIPGIYSAGDVEGGYKQIVTASGQGAGAAMTIFEDIINPLLASKAKLTYLHKTSPLKTHPITNGHQRAVGQILVNSLFI